MTGNPINNNIQFTTSLQSISFFIRIISTVRRAIFCLILEIKRKEHFIIHRLFGKIIVLYGRMILFEV